MPPQPEALLVDTNRGAVPLWRALRDQGWQVTVVGADPQAPLARLCDRYIKANYSDGEALAAIVADRPWQAIIPGCTDASYLACAALPGARLRGFDSPEVVRQLFDKQALRQLASDLAIPQPALLSEQQAIGAEAVLVKPVDGFSGGGISRLDRPTAEQLQQALAVARQRSPSGQALIEEFVQGQLYSHSAFLHNQKIEHDFFVQEDCIDSPYAVDTSCLAVDLEEDVKQQLRTVMQRLAEHLQLVDGLLHSQFLLRDGKAHLLEITRRHPGDLYGLLIQHATGFDYAARYVNGFLAEPIQPRDRPQELRPIIRHTITVGAGCDLWSLRFHEPVLIREWVPLARAGDHLGAAPQGRVAIVFLECSENQIPRNPYIALTSKSLYQIHPSNAIDSQTP